MKQLYLLFLLPLALLAQTSNLQSHYDDIDLLSSNSSEDYSDTIDHGVQNDAFVFVENTNREAPLLDEQNTQIHSESFIVANIQNNDIKIFPNPVRGNEVTIIAKTNLTVEVFNVLGKRVKRQNITRQQPKLNIQGLRKGVYILRLKSDTGTVSKKLVKQ